MNLITSPMTRAADLPFDLAVIVDETLRLSRQFGGVSPVLISCRAQSSLVTGGCVGYMVRFPVVGRADACDVLWCVGEPFVEPAKSM